MLLGKISGTRVQNTYLDISTAGGIVLNMNHPAVDALMDPANRTDKTMQIFHNFYEYDYMDPANLLTSLWRSDGKTGAPQAAWVNPQFDDLVTQAGKEPDTAKRLALFQQAEKILVSDPAAVFLATVLSRIVSAAPAEA